MLAFYDFPAEHWSHLRTTNPIESTFATIRLRHRRTKGCGTRRTSLTMTFKLAQAAQKKWRRLNGSELIVPLMEGQPPRASLPRTNESILPSANSKCQHAVRADLFRTSAGPAVILSARMISLQFDSNFSPISESSGIGWKSGADGGTRSCRRMANLQVPKTHLNNLRPNSHKTATTSKRLPLPIWCARVARCCGLSRRAAGAQIQQA